MNRLKELRENKDLYQKDIAEFLKINQKLADFYDISTDNRIPYNKSIVKEEEK